MAYEYNHWFIRFKNSDVEKIPPHYLDFAMQNCLLAYAEAKAQISLRIWSRPSLSANRITGYKMYDWRAKSRTVLCACAGWSESAYFAYAQRHFFRMTRSINTPVYPGFQYMLLGYCCLWQKELLTCATFVWKGILVTNPSCTCLLWKPERSNLLLKHLTLVLLTV